MIEITVVVCFGDNVGKKHLVKYVR